jgi:hypothetical protein
VADKSGSGVAFSVKVDVVESMVGVALSSGKVMSSLR